MDQKEYFNLVFLNLKIATFDKGMQITLNEEICKTPWQPLSLIIPSANGRGRGCSKRIKRGTKNVDVSKGIFQPGVSSIVIMSR